MNDLKDHLVNVFYGVLFGSALLAALSPLLRLLP